MVQNNCCEPNKTKSLVRWVYKALDHALSKKITCQVIRLQEFCHMKAMDCS